MTRWIALLLALTLTLGVLPAFGEGAAEEAAALPAVGEVIHGFEVREIRDFPMIGARLVLFGHQKTGAKVMYVANDDTYRAFQLSFLTRPLDDTGLPHVFEHATLYGSEKYPSKTLLFNAMYQTYNTYINAYTTDAMTCYPLGSLSEDQLLRLADWYTNSCFHPNIMTDESIYRTQAWHYEMADADSPLTLEGTVYSEMVGAMTLSSTALYNANRATFPGAAISYQYGGIPAHIPEMTWEQLKSYHDLYYHPSNCIAFLYGSLDNYADFLAMLDGEFSQYEKRDFPAEDPGYQPLTAPGVASVPYPVAEGTDPANQSSIIYYILCPGMKGNVEAERVMDHLCALLGSDGSPLMQALKKALPTGKFSVGREVAAPDDAIIFTAENVNEGDGEIFQATINDSLRSVMENGLDAALLDAIAAKLQLQNKLAGESANPIEGVIMNLAYSYATTGNPFAYVDSMEAYQNLETENAQGLYTDAIRDWLLEPALYTLTTTYPAPGEKEKEEAALAASLAEIKAGMSEEEIARVVADTAAQPEEEDNSALMASLKAVDVSSLPEEIKTYESADVTGEDGVRRVDVYADVDGVGTVNLFFDAGALPLEDIHYMRLFTRLLGQLDTDTHSYEELTVLKERYLNSCVIGVQTSPGADAGSVQPWLVAQWTALDEDLAAGYDLMKELLQRSRFTDTRLLSERITAQKAAVRSQINGSPYSVSLYRGLGVGLMNMRYYAYLNFTDYYAFLEQLEAQMAEDPAPVVAGLQRVQRFLLNREGAVAGFAGSPDSCALNRPLADAFLADLPREKRDRTALDLPAPAMAEGFIADTNSGFNSLVASFETLGLEMDGGMPVVTSLVADQLLVPILRDQMGVYTPICSTYDDQGLYLISYRDPNVVETFDVYARIPDWLDQLALDQETLDGYILSAYSSLAKPEGELTGAVSELTRLVEGREELKLKWMRQLKAVTPESVHAAAETFRRLLEKGYRGTAAGAGAINANADLYEAVLNPFGAVDASEVTLSDVPADHESYAAIRFAYENGLMALTGADTFSPDAEATAGNLYAALYLLIGGAPNAEEEALATFSQYGLVPEGVTGDQPLTFALRNQVMSVFGSLVGMEFPAIGDGQEDAVMTRAQLAQDLTIFDDGQ
ncbi:MAG: insulinase family protein [Clostridia bacterium]|nr:insulinase family protein [Clostridia bacterium]